MEDLEASAADWLRIYRQLSDPEERDKARAKIERAKRIDERKKDTGYYDPHDPY